MNSSINHALQGIRSKIDQIDGQVVELLNERMRLVAEIGRLKKERGQSVFAPEREELLLKALEKINSGPLGQLGLRAIYREILSASRANQSKLRVTYLGEELSRSFLAARMRFGCSDAYRAEGDWKCIVQSLEKNEADVGVVPRAALLEVLSGKSSEKPFTRSLRVCGEINLVREIQPDYELVVRPPSWQAIEQFFILTNGVEKQNLEGKSLILLVVPGLKKIADDLDRLLSEQGIRVQSIVPVLPLGERFLCEVEGELLWEPLQELTNQEWGRTAQPILLGTYPNPNIYG